MTTFISVQECANVFAKPSSIRMLPVASPDLAPSLGARRLLARRRPRSSTVIRPVKVVEIAKADDTRELDYSGSVEPAPR